MMTSHASWRTRATVALMLGLAGCEKHVPPSLKPTTDAVIPLAIQVADKAASSCPSIKVATPVPVAPIGAGSSRPAAPPAPPSPAAGTALDADKRVVDVLISCSWPDPKHPDGSIWASSSMTSLRGTSQLPLRHVTMPDEHRDNTCKKTPHNCQQVVTPSRYQPDDNTADVHIVRPLNDGGTVEVTVLVKP